MESSLCRAFFAASMFVRGRIRDFCAHCARSKKKNSCEELSLAVETCMWSREYWDNGKENGGHYFIIGYVFRLYRDNGKEMETTRIGVI